MSEFSDFEYASAALRRVQARAQAQGHYRVPLRSRRRSVSGQSEEFAEEILRDDEQEASEVNLDPQADPDGEFSALSTVVFSGWKSLDQNAWNGSDAAKIPRAEKAGPDN